MDIRTCDELPCSNKPSSSVGLWASWGKITFTYENLKKDFPIQANGEHVAKLAVPELKRGIDNARRYYNIKDSKKHFQLSHNLGTV